MKKILGLTIAVVLVIGLVAGGTWALFTDTETTGTNVFQAGTIDIAVDGENPWSEEFELFDMKPCQTGYITFVIQNVGQNKVVLYKHIMDVVTDEGKDDYSFPGGYCSSEAEYTAGGGEFGTQGNPTGVGYVPRHNIHRFIEYDLKVIAFDMDPALHPDDATCLYNETIYEAGTGFYITPDIACNQIFLGILPPDGVMYVEQSYHLDEDVGNWAQGDEMSFTIEITAEQMPGHLRLENKATNQWVIVTDGRYGELMYTTECYEFCYEFHGYGLEDGDWCLIYYADPWPGVNSKLIDSGTASNGMLHLYGCVDLGTSLSNDKIWLVPCQYFNEGISFTEWKDLAGNSIPGDEPPPEWLFECKLITYDYCVD